MITNELVTLAIHFGFRDPVTGASFLRFAVRCESTDLEEYIETLKRNRPEMFTRASRRTATR